MSISGMERSATQALSQSSDNCTLTFAQGKRYFLQQSYSTGKLPYKRYTHSPLRYTGGKSLTVGLVIERMPDKWIVWNRRPLVVSKSTGR